MNLKSYPYVFLYLYTAITDRIRHNTSAKPAISHTPSIPKKIGRVTIPKIKNMNVLNKDRIPDTIPFENAVNIPLANILNPHN